MDTLKSGLSSSTDTLNMQEFVSKYTANFWSVNFNTMKMKIDADAESESVSVTVWLHVIMFPMDCYLEEHNTRCESQRTDFLFLIYSLLFCYFFFYILLLPWRAQYKKSKPEDRSCTQPGQYHPGRQVDGDHDVKDVNVMLSNMMTTVDGVDR